MLRLTVFATALLPTVQFSHIFARAERLRENYDQDSNERDTTLYRRRTRASFIPVVSISLQHDTNGRISFVLARSSHSLIISGTFNYAHFSIIK